MVARIGFNGQFVATMENILHLERNGYKREQIQGIVGLTRARISRAMRIYLTSLGETSDARSLEVTNKAIDLVKLLEADEISLHRAEEELVAVIKATNGKTIGRTLRSPHNPELQLEAYTRAIASLEGVCYGLEKMPEVVHSSISAQQRSEIEKRLAACRATIERRIKILRKDNNNNAEANH